ncbi:2-isopropylmalate synthase [Gynuella sunshinyii]|uniref:2-isopropylmalate synthase n=1 Tax=Gynuella sunshinyii YC6258 TaxID=1445510 RepID=A0A0C5VHH3_9GAMM|nr:2-isopropylmalate synthase [Gynuella sunshinyii]AJQ92758.1 isopropylmalate/homocitrate/citramalate synthase [Gynuella sunshinyii YC6258]
MTNTGYNFRKYRPFQTLNLTDRTWPNNTITKAPIWCSVDLRDGNQALVEPMTVEQKTRMWNLLVSMGFKEIEVGFPSASQPDYDFVRKIIDDGLVPEDVTIQVLVQAREHLISKTFEALKGAKKAIVHVYNSTSTTQREKVFRLDRQGITDIAVQGAKWVKEYAAKHPDTDWRFQYSPESFTGTEMDFAADVCNAVIEVWQPTPEKPCIINLPATVEVSTPNVFADQIEWMCRHLHHREAVIVSVHTHNDRGTGVAASELGLLAGADRVEGTLFGNGERTGNLDIVTMAMNLYSQGIDSGIDCSNMDDIIQTYKYCNQLEVHPRHPYAGELVFTAFSGSHQDAIRKCLSDQQHESHWNVAYLPIDPSDLGRKYEEVIRINSQSGKGGVTYVMEKDHGYRLPRPLQIHFSQVIQRVSEQTQKEVSPQTIWENFRSSYVEVDAPFSLKEYNIQRDVDKQTDQIKAVIDGEGQKRVLTGTGNGPISAFASAVRKQMGIEFELVDYNEHAIGEGEDTMAVTYMQIRVNGNVCFGVGENPDIVMASLIALLHAVNNAVKAGWVTPISEGQSA